MDLIIFFEIQREWTVQPDFYVEVIPFSFFVQNNYWVYFLPLLIALSDFAFKLSAVTIVVFFLVAIFLFSPLIMYFGVVCPSTTIREFL